MHKQPSNPCESCEHAPCRLPLNCARWTGYLQARRQFWEDAAALKQSKLWKTDDLGSASAQAWRRRLAEACPWVRKEEGE